MFMSTYKREITQALLLSVLVLQGCHYDRPFEDWIRDRYWPSAPQSDPAPESSGPSNAETLGKWCTPEAASFKESELDLEQVRQRVLAAADDNCSLNPSEESPLTLGLSGFGEKGTRSCDSRTCWQTLGTRAIAFSEPYVHFYGPTDFFHRVAVVHARMSDEGALEVQLRSSHVNSTALQDLFVVYDAAGKVLEYKRWFNEDLWFHVINEYEGERLIHSILYDDVNGTVGEERHFSYSDEGLLLGASARSLLDDSVRTMRYDYDASGRLFMIERELNEEATLVQSWEYDDDNQVSVHRNLNGHLLSWWTFGHSAIDDHTPRVNFNHQVVDTQLERRVGDCRKLPVGLGYGFPAGEELYDIGLPQAQRPRGIERMHPFAPVYASYDHGWFGPNGITGSYIDTRASEIETHYNNQNMVFERYLRGGVEESRTRFYDERQQLSSEIFVNDESTRVLTFAHNANGRLVERRLYNQNELLEQHRFQRAANADEGCDLTEYVTAHRGSQWGREDQARLEISGLDAELTHHSRLRVSHSDDCRSISTSLEYGDALIENFQAFNEQGMPTSFASGQYRSEFFYHESGGLLEQRDINNSQTTTRIRQRIDGQGRLTSREWQVSQGINAEVFEYICD